MKEGKDAFNRIINEGASVGLYSILDAPRDAIDNGFLTLVQIWYKGVIF